MSELSTDDVLNWLRMPKPAFTNDGERFAVEWHADETSVDELLDKPLIYHVRGPIDQPTPRQHQWIGTMRLGLMADPETPSDLTVRAEKAFFNWVSTSCV